MCRLSKTVIVPEPQPGPPENEAESLDVWGFRDTRFDFSENGHVIIRGSRYELSGKELPRFLPWVREVLESPVDPRDVNASQYPTSIPEPHVQPEFFAAINNFLKRDQIDTN